MDQLSQKLAQQSRECFDFADGFPFLVPGWMPDLDNKPRHLDSSEFDEFLRLVAQNTEDCSGVAVTVDVLYYEDLTFALVTPTQWTKKIDEDWFIYWYSQIQHNIISWRVLTDEDLYRFMDQNRHLGWEEYA